MMYHKLSTEFYDIDKQFATADELALYQETFSKNEVLLEPMCGSGRLLIPLMQLGYEIHGIDNSSSMLDSLKKRAADLSLNPIVHVQALEVLTLEHKYHGIIIPLGSFQLLYPRENAYKALDTFKKLLLPHGKLIMDCFIPWNAMYEDGKIDTSVRRVNLPSVEFIEAENCTTANKLDQHMLSKTHYTKYSKDKVIAQEDEQMDILWYYPFEMELMLEKQGFKNIKRINRVLNGSDHITFIATAQNN